MKKLKIMKKITYILFFMGTVMIYQGCDKELLDTIPNDRISSEIFWQTEDDAILAANGVYTFMSETDNNQSIEHFIAWDAMSDILFGTPTGPPEAGVAQGDFTALNSRITEDWTTNYAGIRAANSFFANVDRVNTENTELINRLKAEVRALRAFFYSRLAFLYGDVPLVTSEITLQESRQLSRTPVSEVWDFISAELTQAADILPVEQNETGRITKGAAMALKARSMLFAGRYQEAADAAKSVMDLNEYSLYPSYKDLFSYAAEDNEEVILDIQFIKDTYSNNAFQLYAPRSVNANSKWVPTKKMVDAYQMNNGKDISDPTSGFDPYDPYANRDPRLSYSVFVPGDTLPNGAVFNSYPDSPTGDAVGSSFVVSPTGFNVKKYVNAEDLSTPANCGINIITLRYAEVLLTYAEAKIEMNQIDASVYDAINQIRQRPDVNMPEITTGKSQDEMREIVRHERQIELAFEGLRFFDIRRWKIAEDVMPGKVYGLTYIDDNGDLQTVEVPGFARVWGERIYLWPIPQKETELDQNLTQNPGW